MSLLLALPELVAAQSSVTIPSEYDKVASLRTTVTALGPDLFGDEVSLYDGTVQFRQVDVSLPGNDNLPVEIARRFTPRQWPSSKKLFGDWELDIPHLEGVFTSGWIVSATPNTTRCTNYKAPPIANGVQGGQFTAVEYWAGNHLVLSGRKGGGEILKRGASTPAPNDGQSYPLMTKDGAVFRCLNIGANEFFEAVTPDGTRYRFDNMVSRPTTQLTKPNPEPELLTAQKQAGGITPLAAIDYFVNRSEVWILPTVVTDRFGNTVTYNWDSTDRWKLLSITASDGRQLTLTYVSGTRRIYSVSDGTRQWIYDYSAVSGGEPRLSRVTLPDSSQWTFELQGMRDVMRETGGGCGATTSDPASGTGTMTHPSGAQGSFAVAATLHGRSYVPSQCVNGYSYYPAWFATPSLASKTISGPGISAMSWSYVFAENSCYLPCASGAPASKTLTVTGPGGSNALHVR